MARSAFIWIVTRDTTLVAAFTVKHELIAWLKRQESLVWYAVYKMSDNPLIDQSMFTNPTPNVRRIPLDELGV